MDAGRRRDLTTDRGIRSCSAHGTHLVLHGETSDAWIRIAFASWRRRARAGGSVSDLPGSPRRPDKDDILVRDVSVIDAYPPVTVASALEPPPCCAGGREGDER